jgi:hypothetical protein
MPRELNLFCGPFDNESQRARRGHRPQPELPVPVAVSSTATPCIRTGPAGSSSSASSPYCQGKTSPTVVAFWPSANWTPKRSISGGSLRPRLTRRYGPKGAGSGSPGKNSSEASSSRSRRGRGRRRTANWNAIPVLYTVPASSATTPSSVRAKDEAQRNWRSEFVAWRTPPGPRGWRFGRLAGLTRRWRLEEAQAQSLPRAILRVRVGGECPNRLAASQRAFNRRPVSSRCHQR